MNGICPILDAFFGPQDNGDGTWSAIKCDRGGTPEVIEGPFDTEEEAEICAGEEHERQLADNGQWGVGA